MEKYKIEMELIVEEHPRKWLFEAIAELLEKGEDIENWNVEELEEKKEEIK